MVERCVEGRLTEWEGTGERLLEERRVEERVEDESSEGRGEMRGEGRGDMRGDRQGEGDKGAGEEDRGTDRGAQARYVLSVLYVLSLETNRSCTATKKRGKKRGKKE